GPRPDEIVSSPAPQFPGRLWPGRARHSARAGLDRRSKRLAEDCPPYLEFRMIQSLVDSQLLRCDWRPDARSGADYSLRTRNVRVTSEVFASLHGFKQKRFALPAYFFVSGQRSFNIRQQTARDRDQISLMGQLKKFFLIR